MTPKILAAAVLAASPASAASAPTQQPPASEQASAARPDDVASPQTIVAALYDVISGGAGVHRDWVRFRSLFYPGARLIPTGMSRQTGKPGARMLTPEDYIRLSGPLLEGKGFFEREIVSRTERFGAIAHVFTTYESRIGRDDPKPFARGINSVQLYFDGQRWWILNVAWSEEMPGRPLPAQYLRRR